MNAVRTYTQAEMSQREIAEATNVTQQSVATAQRRAFTRAEKLLKDRRAEILDLLRASDEARSKLDSDTYY
jgi:predicted XRE-type DNA-binding protein